MKLKKVIICFFAVLVSFILPIENTVHADTVHFRNCSEAWAAGYGDILVGEPGYAGHLDRDKDGTACEIFKSGGQYRSRREDGKPLNKVKATGWEQVDSKWYYYENYVMVTGWKKISGIWYYFNSSGVMQTGWQQLSGTWYYFNSAGAMETGLKEIGGTKYYFTDSGAMQTGWKWIADGYYYFKSSGAMQTGWYQENNKWYYLAENGKMVTGLYQVYHSTYYFDGSGVMKTDWIKLGHGWHYFDKSGTMLRNTVTPDGYYVDQEGIWKELPKVSTTTELIPIEKAEAVPETTVQTTTEEQVQ